MRNWLVGSASISRDFSSVLTSALSVCSSVDDDSTVTVSVSAPTSSVTSTRATWPTDTGTFSRCISLKPVSVTLMSYGPASTLIRL